ncbi:unnamed protein product [Rotaria sp. Silwood2]|nr:unnamed protein product [Rotaria sp. Silwood2]CAF3319734.1 unnamed protein product [Rotaria sp. Silwood2]CAF4289075.1 unnamed protein product [Rotaria sp. Silwood2]CAF4320099.1 unnamed protein product [Rotaria sp. Silwood2]
MLTNHLLQDTCLSSNGEPIFSWQQVRRAFIDWKVYIYMFIYMGNATIVHSLIIFLPTLISEGSDLSNAHAQLMSAPPNLMSSPITLIAAFSAARFQERGYHITGILSIGIVGCILLITLAKYGLTVLYIVTCLTCIGTFSTIPLIMSWFTNNIGGYTKRAVATGLIVGSGNMSGIVSGHIYRAQDAPYFLRGHFINLGFMSAIFVASLVFKYILFRENRRRDSLSIRAREQELEQCGPEPCDAHPDFRYTT